MKTFKVNSYSLYRWEGWDYLVYIIDDKGNTYYLDKENIPINISLKCRLIKILHTPRKSNYVTHEGEIGTFGVESLSRSFDTGEEAIDEYYLEKL